MVTKHGAGRSRTSHGGFGSFALRVSQLQVLCSYEFYINTSIPPFIVSWPVMGPSYGSESLGLQLPVATTKEWFSAPTCELCTPTKIKKDKSLLQFTSTSYDNVAWLNHSYFGEHPRSETGPKAEPSTSGVFVEAATSVSALAHGQQI